MARPPVGSPRRQGSALHIRRMTGTTLSAYARAAAEDQRRIMPAATRRPPTHSTASRPTPPAPPTGASPYQSSETPTRRVLG